MIVNVQPDRVQIVRQRDHARLSGAIADAWRRPTEFSDEHWDRFCQAVRIHDDGWGDECNTASLGEDGLPRNFKQIDGDLHHNIWLRSIELASFQDPFAGLLVAMHSRRLEIDFGEKNVATEKFIERLERIIAQLIEGLQKSDSELVEPELLEESHQLLLYMDGFSLMLLGGIDWIDQTKPLAIARQRIPISLSKTDAGCAMDPWPFESDVVEEKVATYICNQDEFTDDASLRSRLEDEPTTLTTVQITRQP